MMQSIQSRLKSRKVLGVGEGANGRQHRSKITQILGCDSLTDSQLSSSDYPVLLKLLQYATCLLFLTIGLVLFFMPGSEFLDDVLGTGIAKGDDMQQCAKDLMYARKFGAAMITLASLFFIVTFNNWQSRRAVRISLFVLNVYIIFDFLTVWMDSDTFIWTSEFRLSLLIRAIILLLSSYFYNYTGISNPSIPNRAGE